MNIPTTKNQAWGFWGTMNEHADAAWPIALPAIVDATGSTPEGVRAFLDSRHGRHFADDVQSRMYEGMGLEDAIHAAIERWMSWKISRTTSKDLGTPRGLPYLTGFVHHHEIAMEMAE
jgi:hypothetical protein